MNKIFIIISIYLFSLQLSAQILNVEKERKLVADSTTHWIGNLNLSFNMEQRELPILNISNFNNLAYYSEQHLYLLISTIQLTRASEEMVESNGYSHIRLNFWNRKVVSLEFFGQLQYDKTRGLDSRFLSGVGLRFLTVNNTRTLLYFGLGSMYEEEQWNFEGDQGFTKLFKYSSYISASQVFKDNFFANAIVYYQARWDLFQQPRIIADVSFNLTLSKHIKFTITYLLWIDTRPIVKVDNMIYMLSTGLTIDF